MLAGCSGAPHPAATPAAASAAPALTSPAAPAPAPAPRDRAALRQLHRAAATSAEADGADGPVTGVDCWTPSEHLLADPATPGVFSVLCRVHYRQATTPRYKDMTCIGDFFASPMLSRCYRWAYYSAEPRFEDGPRLASPPPTPFPTPEATQSR